jgi:hypothetical protein
VKICFLKTAEKLNTDTDAWAFEWLNIHHTWNSHTFPLAIIWTFNLFSSLNN